MAPDPSRVPHWSFSGFFTLGIGRVFKVESFSVTKVAAVVIRSIQAHTRDLATETDHLLALVSPALSSFRSQTRHKLRPPAASSPWFLK